MLLSVQTGMLAWQAWTLGVTVDEPAHLLNSYLYWRGQDHLPPRDFPPLVKLVSGWMPVLLELPLPRGPEAWRELHEWPVAINMINQLNPRDIQRLFFFSRLPVLVFPIATTILVFLWAHALSGPRAGLAAAFLFALEPTSLGHGAILKNDHAAAFGYLLFWFMAWRFWRDPGLKSLGGLTAGLLVAVLAKLSMLPLLAIAPVFVVARLLRNTRKTDRARGRDTPVFRNGWAPRAAAFALLGNAPAQQSAARQVTRSSSLGWRAAPALCGLYRKGSPRKVLEVFLPAAGLVAVVYFGVLCASRFEASRLSADEY
ncbi:MAG: hypothetical protein HY235_22910, partial [Acidobacteria bacterium]|nr:hypothetical protein [Acidobacteriota bacterium]